MLGQFAFQRLDDAFEEDHALAAQRVHLIGELLVGEGVGVAEGQVFQFAAQLAHAQAVGQRRVDVQRLLGDLLPLLGDQVLQSAHVVQAVGQLDDDDADVGDHGQQHLADVLGLVLLAVGKLDLVQLGDAFDDVRHLLAEALLDLFGGHIGVFDGVVQQAGGDGGGVHLQLRQHQRDLQRMARIGFAGGALLALMLLQTEGPRLTDDLQIVARPVLMDLREQAGELGIHLADGLRAGAGKVLGRGLLRRAVLDWIRVGQSQPRRAAPDAEASVEAGAAELSHARCLRPSQWSRNSSLPASKVRSSRSFPGPLE